jgi:hypothetical protein
LISPVFVPNNILLTAVKLKVGVPAASKKWCPSGVIVPIGGGRVYPVVERGK